MRRGPPTAHLSAKRILHGKHGKCCHFWRWCCLCVLSSERTSYSPKIIEKANVHFTDATPNDGVSNLTNKDYKIILDPEELLR